ncbi:Chromosome partition protein Smc [uncultured archaeon]|nr:Chromosome partition protein Smc [uncultured archaeon]
MGLDDLLISTGVDSLIKLVRERGKIEIREAAATLGVPVQSVEDWAHVLEGEGLIKIQYQLTQVMLIWTPLASGEREKRQINVGERKTQTVKKLESLAQNAAEGGVELSALQEQLRGAQTRGQSRLQKLSADLSESQKLNSHVEKVLSERQASLGQLKTDLASMRSEMAEFQKALESLPGREGQPEIEEQMKKLGSAEDQLENRLKAARQVFDSVQEHVNALQARLAADKTAEEIETLKHTMADLSFARAEMEKTGTNILHESKMLGEELEHAQAKLKQIEAHKLEKVNPKKMMEQASEMSKKVQAERETVLHDLEQTLEAVKKQVQAYAQTQYQYQTISARIESMGAALNKNSTELEEMEKTLSRAGQTYSKDLADARDELEKERGEYDEMAKKAKDIEEMLSHLQELGKAGEQLEIKLHGLIKEAQIYGLTAPAMSAGKTEKEGKGAKGSGSGGAAGATGPKGPAYGAGVPVPPGSRAGGEPELPPELARRVAITSAEEEEFEKKRQELSLLVKRMWDEDRKPKGG